MRTSLLLALAAAPVLSACDSNGTDAPTLTAVTRVTSLAADPGTRDASTGQVRSTGRFTLYSLREGKVVLDHTNASRADSATATWDIGFRGATIIVNGGSRGPGQGAAQVVASAFEALTAAPATGYDASGTVPFNAGSTSIASVWTYTPSANLMTPTPGKTLVVKTADGKYAKVKVVSYYQGNPATPTAESVSRYVTFDYVLQTNGTASFQ